MAAKRSPGESSVYYEKSTRGKSGAGGQHYHESFEVYFLERGCCHYFIDDMVYDVEAGDVVLIPEGTIHKTMYDNAEYIRRLIYFPPSYIPATVAPRLTALRYVYRNPILTVQIRALFDAMEQESRDPDLFSPDLLRHYVEMLFFLLARNTDVAPLPASGSVYTTETIAYIKENYREELRLSELARRCSVSPEHLSRQFKKETGFGVSEYLSMIRLQQAQRLLCSSPELSIAAVADRCGYNDSNYFSSLFKRTYGLSPTRFRKR